MEFQSALSLSFRQNIRKENHFELIFSSLGFDDGGRKPSNCQIHTFSLISLRIFPNNSCKFHKIWLWFSLQFWSICVTYSLCHVQFTLEYSSQFHSLFSHASITYRWNSSSERTFISFLYVLNSLHNILKWDYGLIERYSYATCSKLNRNWIPFKSASVF